MTNQIKVLIGVIWLGVLVALAAYRGAYRSADDWMHCKACGQQCEGVSPTGKFVWIMHPTNFGGDGGLSVGFSSTPSICTDCWNAASVDTRWQWCLKHVLKNMEYSSWRESDHLLMQEPKWLVASKAQVQLKQPRDK